MKTMQYLNFASLPSATIRAVIESGVSHAINSMSASDIKKLITNPLQEFKTKELQKAA